MSAFDLDKPLEDSFEFQLGGNIYDFRYPTTEELFNTPDKEDANAVAEYFYAFVTPRDKNAPSIGAALAGKNVKYFRRFVQMAQTKITEEDA